MNNLQNPTKKREICCDEKLKTIFQAKDKVDFLEGKDVSFWWSFKLCLQLKMEALFVSLAVKFLFTFQNYSNATEVWESERDPPDPTDPSRDPVQSPSPYPQFVHASIDCKALIGRLLTPVTDVGGATMTVSEDEDEGLAYFLESEVLSEVSDQEEAKREEEEALVEPKPKRFRLENDNDEENSITPSPIQFQAPSSSKTKIIISNTNDSGDSDLVACSLVCTFLNYAASDESLWRRLYCMRWGLLPPTKKLRECAWKKLYIQRDEEDMVEFVRNCPSEFKEYYIQMQAAKRSQAPLPSQVNDDRIILDNTVADQVSMWKSSRGLTDKVVSDHACSGETCSYYQIGDVFVCEKTGHVHVCDDTCREVVLDPANELLVCTISGHCFDRLLSPAEMEPDIEQLQGGVSDEAEPFMGSGRFARAYLLGYNCADEKELEACLSPPLSFSANPHSYSRLWHHHDRKATEAASISEGSNCR
ncbi:hypothetical protein F0562_011771 [Nyssa sinensis]|uniref:Uncharacterized protein n=1 Tax=Nyssa sinensis TaxID=561372 RepID=A0A5J4ZTD7_9ASTE|nr:hypothetical protein F0562_011771 [Nyssa sinensis]